MEGQIIRRKLPLWKKYFLCLQLRLFEQRFRDIRLKVFIGKRCGYP